MNEGLLVKSQEPEMESEILLQDGADISGYEFLTLEEVREIQSKKE